MAGQMKTRTFLLGSLLAFVAGVTVNHAFRPSAPLTENLDRARQQITEYYIVEPAQDDLERGAINGMVGTLDDYSELLSPEAYQRLLSKAEGSFAGVVSRSDYDKAISPSFASFQSPQRRHLGFRSATSSRQSMETR